MSELQIKITLGGLDVYLQGDGDLVYKVFSDIRQNGMGKLEESKSMSKICNALNGESPKEENVEPSTQITSSKTKNRKKTVQITGQLLKDLDLSGKGTIDQSLKNFVAKKNPKTNIQKTTVFLYYLQHILNIEEITIDHIFTCYKNMGYRMPNNLPQNLNDVCGSRYGYANRTDGKLSMTVIGDNYIEHDINNEE